ncbi:MAG: ABC transporter substrate-binding protein [Bacteroidetes bacterium]|nr:ABC transporter substrate-binding protein [Bacteroidota bacterium]MCL5026048.1 ABC transporter substrate-binding protein [Chloroflexota bacterium]
MRRSVCLPIAALVIFGLLVACAPTEPTAVPSAPTVVPKAEPAATPKPATPVPTPGPKIKRGGTLRYAETGSMATTDPIRSNLFTQISMRLLYDALFRYRLMDDKTGRHELQGNLVESWKLDDPKTFTFKLRQGVKFHDGSVWNAEVAKWNLDRALTDKTSTAKPMIEAIDSVEVVDPNTIRLKLKTPNAGLLINLSGVITPVSIVSKAAMDSLGPDGFNNKPSGTGPFQFQEWIRDDRISVKKFDGYWRMGADGKPLPYVDGLVSRVIPDTTVMLMELRAGTLDIVKELEPKDVVEAQKNPDLIYWAHPAAPSTRHLGLNEVKGPFAGDANIKLRQALLYATDKDTIAKTLTFGLGYALKYPSWPPNYLGYDETIPHYSFDLNKAKQLMAESGVATLNTAVTSVNRPIDVRIAQMLQQMWGQIGIKAEAEAFERVAAMSKMISGETTISIWGGEVGADADQNTRNFGTGAPGNYSGLTDPRVDKLLEQARSTYDEKERAAYYKQLQTIVYEHASLTGIYYFPWAMVYNKSVKGATSQWKTADLSEIWLDR